MSLRKESRQERGGEEEKAQAEKEEVSGNWLNQKTTQEHAEVPTMRARSGNQKEMM